MPNVLCLASRASGAWRHRSDSPRLTLSGGSLWIVILSSAAAVLTTLLLSVFNRRSRRHTPVVTILLTGVVFNAFAAAVITFVKFLVPMQRTQQMTFWLSGCLDTKPVAPFYRRLLCPGGDHCSLPFISQMNVLALGDSVASTLGVNPLRTRGAVFVWSSLLTGASRSRSRVLSGLSA